MVKNLLANTGDRRDVGLILGWKDPLEKGMATRSSAWEIPWTEEPGGLPALPFSLSPSRACCFENTD